MCNACGGVLHPHVHQERERTAHLIIVAVNAVLDFPHRFLHNTRTQPTHSTHTHTHTHAHTRQHRDSYLVLIVVACTEHLIVLTKEDGVPHIPCLFFAWYRVEQAITASVASAEYLVVTEPQTGVHTLQPLLATWGSVTTKPTRSNIHSDTHNLVASRL